MIAIAFALPQESRAFIAALNSGQFGSHRMVVFHTGMGPAAASAGLQQFWEKNKDHPIEGIIGAGFAGGLDPSLPAGSLVLGENYPELISAAQRLLGCRAHVGRIATAPNLLETPEAKAQLARETGAVAVDMESSVVAAFFKERGVHFLSLRVISDPANMPLPVPSHVWLDGRTQHPRPWALLRFLCRHPSRVMPFLRFVRSVFRGRRILATALRDLLAGGIFTQADAAAGPAPRLQ